MSIQGFASSTFLALMIGALVGLGGGIAVALLWLWTYRRARTSQEREVIGYIAAILAQGLPLPAGLRAAADSESGPVQKRLDALADTTARGEMLGTALATCMPECSGLTRSLIQAGERTRQLPAAVRLAQQAIIARDDESTCTDRGAGLYALLILGIASGLFAYQYFLIIPKVADILGSFEVTLPPVTMAAIRSARILSGGVLIIVAALLILGLIASCLRLRSRRPEAPRLTTQVADSARWLMPGLHRLEFARGLSLAFRTMRLAMDAGVPLCDAARASAYLDVNIHLRESLRSFADQVERGADAGSAAAECGLGAMSATALGACRRGGSVAAGLRYAADYYDAVISRWSAVMRQAAWPVCTLVLATIVALFALALFTPLIALINSAETW